MLVAPRSTHTSPCKKIPPSHEIAMSSKRPRLSSDDKVDVRRFIDDIAMVEEEEEVEGEDEDPDQSEPSLLHP